MFSKRQIILASAIALLVCGSPAVAQQRPGLDRQDFAQAEPAQPNRNKQTPDKQPPKGAQQQPAPARPSVPPKSAQQPPASPQQPPRQGQDIRPEHRTPTAVPTQPQHVQEQHPSPVVQPSGGPQEHRPATTQPRAPVTGTRPPNLNAPQGQPQTTQQQPPRGGPPMPPNGRFNAQQRPGQLPTTPQQTPGGAETTFQQPQQPPGATPQTAPSGPRMANPPVQQRTPVSPQNAQQASPPQLGAPKLDELRQERHQRVENNGQRTVIEEPGHTIIEENGRAVIRHDETERFRLLGGDIHVEQRSGETATVVRRQDNVEIVTIVDANGRLLRRVRRMPDGREFVLIDNRPRPGIAVGLESIVVLPPLRLAIPREAYIVDTEELPPQRIVETLEAPPLERLERAYTLDEIRYSMALRDRMRRIDLNTINFDTGSWQVEEDQVPRLAAIADAVNAIIRHNPNEMFLIEGHTDAVGSDVDNLSLSDRRAEQVALVLTQNFQVPPENLTTQGYGAHELKVQTMEPSRENRRVTIRRITPLLTGAAR